MKKLKNNNWIIVKNRLQSVLILLPRFWQLEYYIFYWGSKVQERIFSPHIHHLQTLWENTNSQKGLKPSRCNTLVLIDGLIAKLTGFRLKTSRYNALVLIDGLIAKLTGFISFEIPGKIEWGDIQNDVQLILGGRG